MCSRLTAWKLACQKESACTGKLVTKVCLCQMPSNVQLRSRSQEEGGLLGQHG
ncbi:mCG1030139, isoform CRA_b [Mus musculus]|nr:mCG1030139, isoform CRA_b [Mus musculus]